MPSNIERLNYYEREHLRSFDFIAEQNYHLEMRRRLNLALHLWGIVEGLEIRKGGIVPGAPDQFFITEGMAIDAYGREIVLFAPYTLTEEDLVNNRIGQTGGTGAGGTGRYSLWIEYERKQTTPPSPGYGICDATGQYTRWSESAKVVIKDDTFANGTEPRVFDTLSDDPKENPWLVRLGTVVVGPDPLTTALTFIDAIPESRVYIGLRAQRVVTPQDATQSFDILKPNTPLLPPTSLAIKANLFAEQNEIVGTDFEVKLADIVPPPVPPFPNLTGNLKVATDLFLQGNFYSKDGTKWLSLAEKIKALTPEVLVGFRPITIPSPNPTDPGNGVEKFTIPTTKLKSVGSAQIAVSIAAVKLNEQQVVNQILGAVGPTAQLFYQVTLATAARGQNSPASCDIEIVWKVGPTFEFAIPGPSTEFRSPIVGLTFAYMVIANPVT